MKKINFQLSGVVVHGQQIGKKIGFPTANIAIKKPLPIKQGVYLVQVKVPNHPTSYWGMSDYWTNPETGLIFETYLFDFDEDIYDQTLTIQLLYYYRENVAIKTLNDLKKQLNEDAKEIKKLILKIQTGSGK